MLLALKARRAKLTKKEAEAVRELIYQYRTPRGAASLIKRVGDCLYPTIYPFVANDGALPEGTYRLFSDLVVKVLYCDQGYILTPSGLNDGYGFPTSISSNGSGKMALTNEDSNSAYLAEMLLVPDIRALSLNFDRPIYIVRKEVETGNLSIVSGFYQGLFLDWVAPLSNMCLSHLLKGFPW